MPPVGMTDYTFAYGDIGTILNTDSISFPFIDVTSVSGLDTAPQRATTDEHQGMDGTYIDNPFMSARTIVIGGTLYTAPNDPDTLLNFLRVAYQSSSVQPFYFQLPGQPLKFVNCQGGGLKYDIDTNRRTGKTPVQFTLLAGDPYIYDFPGATVAVNAPAVVNLGMGFNVSFNLGFGGSIPNQSATVSNNGTHTAYPIITLSGPLTNPVLVDSNGVTMAFNISLSAGDMLVIDCRNKSVVLNGTISRRSTLNGIQWFKVASGTSDSIFFGASAGTGSASIQLYNTYY